MFIIPLFLFLTTVSAIGLIYSVITDRMPLMYTSAPATVLFGIISILLPE